MKCIMALQRIFICEHIFRNGRYQMKLSWIFSPLLLLVLLHPTKQHTLVALPTCCFFFEYGLIEQTLASLVCNLLLLITFLEIHFFKIDTDFLVLLMWILFLSLLTIFVESHFLFLFFVGLILTLLKCKQSCQTSL